jgi:hypothetical protein
MSIIFLDERERSYQEGDVTLTMDFFETGETVDFNGGVPTRNICIEDVLICGSGLQASGFKELYHLCQWLLSCRP